MTWTKTGDEFADECWTLSDAAYRLHHEGLTWSNRKQTDGRLAKEDMVRWAKRPAAAEELVAIGWWEDHGEHYQIIHHIGYQRTADQIAHQSIINTANRAKGKARPVRPKSKPQDDSSNDSSDERDRTGQAWITDRGTSPSEAAQLNATDLDLCQDCRRQSPVGASARSGDDPARCRECNEACRADAAAVENVEEVLGGRKIGGTA